MSEIRDCLTQKALSQIRATIRARRLAVAQECLMIQPKDGEAAWVLVATAQATDRLLAEMEEDPIRWFEGE